MKEGLWEKSRFWKESYQSEQLEEDSAAIQQDLAVSESHVLNWQFFSLNFWFLESKYVTTMIWKQVNKKTSNNGTEAQINH